MLAFFKKILLLIVLLSCAGLYSPVFANTQGYTNSLNQQLNATAGEQGANFGKEKDPRLVVAYLVQVFLGFLGILFIGYTVYGGYLILTSAGSEEQISNGKATIRRAIIGGLITLSAYSITLFAAKLATGDSAHQGDYIEIAPDNRNFQDSDPYNDTDPTPFDPYNLPNNADGSQGVYQNPNILQ